MLMLTGISHIGVAVRNLDETLQALCKVLAIPEPEIREASERKMRFALVRMGGVDLEILEDYSEEGIVGKFTREHGNGIHHFSVITNDIENDLSALQQNGINTIHSTPVMGLRGKRIAFISPQSTTGINIELSEA
jgi:methylmalonyl-CoA/ethylmalonyl-CoA epimerase